MPFTPFHLGPALLLGLLLFRWLDFTTFLAANIFVDIRAMLVYFGLLNGPLHGPFHTFFGATVLAGCLGVVSWSIRPYFSSVLDVFRVPQTVSRRRVFTAAVLGMWLHVFLDAILYADMQPFAPISGSNPFLGLVGYLSIYGGSIVAGGLGLGVYGLNVTNIVDVTAIGDI